MTRAEKARAAAQNMRQIPYYQELRANGRGAWEAMRAVRRHWVFMRDLSARVKLDAKRAKAARKGWRTRRKNNCI